MANLLYAEYNTGCSPYWTSDTYGVGDYHYGEGAVLACYYADLEPNTTYTIQRIDTSTRFRVALSSQDLKYLSASSSTVISSPFSWGYKADSSNPVTFTTGDTNTHLVVYYTNISEYSTRVMLNEGSSIEPYTAPTRYFKNHWRLINGKLINNDLPEPIESNLTPPYPASLWRLDSDGTLTLNGEDWAPFPEALNSFTPPYPATVWYLDDENLILLNIFLPDELLMPPEPEGGAFYNAESLEYVKIPRTVTSIGVESFKGTNLKKVCISRNCKYYPSSFPSGCEVTFYEDMYDEKYRITISGKNSYRYTDTITHDEESTMNEIP